MTTFLKFSPVMAVVLSWLVLPSSAYAQNRAAHSFAASQQVVQSTIPAAGPLNGKLPVLEGFVVQTEALDSYRNGYYQLSVEVVPKDANESTVQVLAKITAWYTGKNSSQSGYRVLTSNGRLESDFLDRLEEALHQTGGLKVTAPSPQPSNEPALSSAPESPGSISVISTLNKAAAPALPTKAETAQFAANAGNEQRIQQLKQQVNDLEQVLRNQAHPDNLVAVKHSGTPVYSRPFDQSTVVLRAQAEDEFQLVSTAGSWVHIQISGLSRGWIQRPDVDMLSSRTVPAEAPAPVGATGQPAPGTPQYQTREETSMFPGNWAPLRGKTVRIIWVHASTSTVSGEEDRIKLTRTVFRKAYPELLKSASDLAGVVVVFDAEDGGMAAATAASLQQWSAGHLSDGAFWKQCWLDPAEAFKVKD